MVCKDFNDICICLENGDRTIKVTYELYNKMNAGIQSNVTGGGIHTYSSITIIPTDENEDFRNKLRNKSFTQEELEEIMWEEPLPKDFIYIDVEEDNDVNDWQRSCRVIFKDVKKNKHYALNYFKGLGEYQPNEVDEQPYEVTPVEKTIVVYEDVEEEIL